MPEIVTNNKPRPILSWDELSEKQKAFVRKEYDWLFDKNDDRYKDDRYIAYKNWIYLLSEFICLDDAKSPKGWHGSFGESWFSGVLIKLLPDNETCIVGTYYA